MTDSLAAVRVDIDGPLTDMWRTVLLVAPKLLAFLAILLIGWLVATGLRNVVNQVLAQLVPFYGIVDALLIFSDSRQCVHDKIADTVVVLA